MIDYPLPPLPTVYPICKGKSTTNECNGTLLPFYVFEQWLFAGIAWKCERCGKVIDMPPTS